MFKERLRPFGYGGFSIHQAQEYRVKRAIATEFLRGLCNPVVPESLDPYDREEIMKKMIDKSGFRLELVRVGEDPK